ncbi:hypothetical protein POM88_029104 [Heracleum sosnowskyi]|uniref:Uncharacterized protein n=1 Tax=Heracleum sosnowskyi TaxID=360622 RepID=A0AAD8HU42_9APIA|nr:hypothetical protein POM88_029104 [Heracleum sosnowskyi]
MQWNTPIPYLYAFLGALLGFITMGLLYLAFCKINSLLSSSSSSSSSSLSPDLVGDHRNEEEQSKNMNMISADEPSFVVVIMAGHETATYLAEPMPYAGPDQV